MRDILTPKKKKGKGQADVGRLGRRGGGSKVWPTCLKTKESSLGKFFKN